MNEKKSNGEIIMNFIQFTENTLKFFDVFLLYFRDWIAESPRRGCLPVEVFFCIHWCLRNDTDLQIMP